MPSAGTPSLSIDTEGTSTAYLRDASVNITTSDTTVASARGQRRVLILYNAHASVDIYVSLGSACTTTSASFVLKTTDPYYEISGYTGPVHATTASGTSTLFVTELT